MADTRGVFSLSRAFARSKKGTWVFPDEGFTSSALGNDAAYFGGGSPGPVSTVDRLTYSTQTTEAVPGAALYIARQEPGANSSPLAGYWSGGHAPSAGPSPISSTDKVTYSTETGERLPATANLSAARYNMGTTGNSTQGYFSGGSVAFSSSHRQETNKLTYSSDTMAYTPSANIPQLHSMGAEGGITAGYICGGIGPGGTALAPTYKIVFGTDTQSAAPSANLTFARWGTGAMGNRFKMYITGGESHSGGGSVVERLDFIHETTARAPSANLPTAIAKAYTGAAANQSSGFLAGGPGPVSNVGRIDFDSETAVQVPGAALSIARNLIGGTSPRGQNIKHRSDPTNLKNNASFNFGYINGGSPGGPYLSIVDKVNFDTDTVERVSTANLSTAGANIGASASLDAAYAAGGARTAQVTIVDKITMATDTAARVPGADLSQASQGLAGCGNKDAGYYAGGTPGSISTMNKLTYSTDSTQGLPAGALSAGRPYLGATSNQRFGYWIGGSGPLSTVDKMDFGTDLTARQPTADLPTPQQLVSGTAGNERAGYICGGGTPNVSTCTRLDYNVDTSAVIPTAAMSSNRQRVGGTGNINNGYYCGGTVPGDVSTVDKLNFTNDVSVSLPNGNLTGNRSFTSGSSSRMYGNPQSFDVTLTEPTSIPGSVNNGGYHCGGYNDTSLHKSEVMKINFATDNVARVPGANLSGARYRQTATASNEAGYNAGGRISGGSRVTTMDKTTLSSETTSAVPGAALTQLTYGAAAGSCSTHGYFAGGAPGGAYRSRVDKLTFSSDTTAASPNNLPANTFYGDSSVSSPGFAYQGGGVTSSPVSSFTKIHFTTDTVTTVPSATLSASKYSQSAVGNTREGYFFGGNPGQISIGDRLTFSTETVQRTANYPLAPGTYETSASGNQSAGYLFGGANPAPENISHVYKFTYDTETFDIIGGTGDTQGNAVSSGFAAREGGASHTSNVL